MTWTDPILLGLFGMAAWDGWRRGFIVQAADVVILTAAIYLTVLYSTTLADWLVIVKDLHPMAARMLAPASIFVGVQIIGALTMWVVQRFISEDIRDSRVNRVAGIVPALLKVATYAAIVLAIMAAVPNPRSRAAVDGAFLGPPLAGAGRTVARWFGLSIDEAVERAMHNLTVSNKKPAHGGHERIAIPAITDDWRLRVEPAQEEQMLVLVNQERKRAGLAPLKLDEQLRTVARGHSRDMWTRGYFAHADPQGKDVADRVRAADIPYEVVGENIALAPTLATAHEGLMNSPDHRANILSPNYHRAGIGIILGGSSGLMVTQNFRD